MRPNAVCLLWRPSYQFPIRWYEIVGNGSAIRSKSSHPRAINKSPPHHVATDLGYVMPKTRRAPSPTGLVHPLTSVLDSTVRWCALLLRHWRKCSMADRGGQSLKAARDSLPMPDRTSYYAICLLVILGEWGSDLTIRAIEAPASEVDRCEIGCRKLSGALSVRNANKGRQMMVPKFDIRSFFANPFSYVGETSCSSQVEVQRRDWVSTDHVL